MIRPPSFRVLTEQLEHEGYTIKASVAPLWKQCILRQNQQLFLVGMDDSFRGFKFDCPCHKSMAYVSHLAKTVSHGTRQHP